ncbi:MAG: ATP-binding protein, partial [Bacteroidia bacterium]
MNAEIFAEELKIAKKQLAFEYEEKAKRAAELVIANIELAFQNTEKAKREAELMIANKELIFQNEEKGNRAAELIIANIELAFQNQEKAKRAAELMIANKEHAFESEEKEKRATELVTANIELAYQNEEKAKRSDELIIANIELAFQNEQKEKRATEMNLLNKELEQFAYIASHDLQQPLRTVSNYISLFEEKYSPQLDDTAKKYILSANNAIKRMNALISSLLTFSRVGYNRTLANVDLNKTLKNVLDDHEALIKSSNTVIEISVLPVLNVYETEIYQLFQNLITNAIKFQKESDYPKISISAEEKKGKWQFSIKDNGIGIDSVYFEKIFEIFQRLHGNKEYEGSGIGLANCKKIVQLHQGEIWLESKP